MGFSWLRHEIGSALFYFTPRSWLTICYFFHRENGRVVDAVDRVVGQLDSATKSAFVAFGRPDAGISGGRIDGHANGEIPVHR